MKNLTLSLLAGVLIFAVGTVAFSLDNNAVYTSIDWKKYLPRPIYPIADSLLIPDTLEVKTRLALI